MIKDLSYSHKNAIYLLQSVCNCNSMNYTVSIKKKKKLHVGKRGSRETTSAVEKPIKDINLHPHRENCCFKVTVVPIYAK